MKTKCQYVIVAVVVLVLTGCFDTGYDILYQIENQTEQTLSIETVIKRNHHDEQEKSFSVAPCETVRVADESGINGPKYVPHDEWHYYPEQISPSTYEKFDIHIRVVDDLLQDDLRQSKNWDYEAKKLLGVYTLRITKDRVEEYKQLTADN